MNKLTLLRQVIEREDILDERFIEKSYFKNEEDYLSILTNTIKTLKKHGINSLIGNKDLKILYSQRKNVLFISQHAIMDIEEIISVTDDMKKAGIKGETITQKYSLEDEFILHTIRNPKNELLSDLSIKKLPKPKIDNRQVINTVKDIKKAS